MAILTRDNNVTPINQQQYFNVRLNDDEFIRFVISKNFSSIVTSEEVAYKLLTQCDIQTTKPGKQGAMNFKLLAEHNGTVHIVGFLNFYKNDLNAISSDEQIQKVLETLGSALDSISIQDVQKPMSETEASDFINDFLSEPETEVEAEAKTEAVG